MPHLQETEEPHAPRDDLRRLGALHLQFHGRGPIGRGETVVM